MQIITQGTNSTLIFTVTEKKTLSTPYWLFELRLRGTSKVKRFIAANQSSYTDRYDQFLITESVNELLTSGTIYLPDTGDYEYRIFEQSSASNLNPDLATSECENGILRVVSSSGDTIITNQPTPTTVVYNPS